MLGSSGSRRGVLGVVEPCPPEVRIFPVLFFKSSVHSLPSTTPHSHQLHAWSRRYLGLCPSRSLQVPPPPIGDSRTLALPLWNNHPAFSCFGLLRCGLAPSVRAPQPALPEARWFPVAPYHSPPRVLAPRTPERALPPVSAPPTYKTPAWRTGALVRPEHSRSRNPTYPPHAHTSPPFANTNHPTPPYLHRSFRHCRADTPAKSTKTSPTPPPAGPAPRRTPPHSPSPRRSPSPRSPRSAARPSAPAARPSRASGPCQPTAATSRRWSRARSPPTRSRPALLGLG